MSKINRTTLLKEAIACVKEIEKIQRFIDEKIEAQNKQAA